MRTMMSSAFRAIQGPLRLEEEDDENGDIISIQGHPGAPSACSAGTSP